MKKFIVIKAVLLLVAATGFSQTVTDIQYTVQPVYGYRKDGKPGREMLISFGTARLKKNATVQVKGLNIKETSVLTGSAAGDSVKTILLPTGVGVDSAANISVVLQCGSTLIEKKVHVPRMRHWTVFIYPHSHVDIGYTNTQKMLRYCIVKMLLKALN
ncbi:hypothetical protein [Niabella hibiscisoli]|uniref:hypothetical protein n=1 Tax=Niabella hibiscisoli TaxID=1825928 RepID=UPI001F0F578A|nr:hypothetical protein [Niabella hibiscisoli]MCH5719007.1 hypothetical protein [Niabella hibiscisoli]